MNSSKIRGHVNLCLSDAPIIDSESCFTLYNLFAHSCLQELATYFKNLPKEVWGGGWGGGDGPYNA